jgi:hypothetical protein
MYRIARCLAGAGSTHVEAVDELIDGLLVAGEVL